MKCLILVMFLPIFIFMSYHAYYNSLRTNCLITSTKCKLACNCTKSDFKCYKSCLECFDNLSIDCCDHIFSNGNICNDYKMLRNVFDHVSKDIPYKNWIKHNMMPQHLINLSKHLSSNRIHS
jgi:hypothetical protein